MSVKFLKSLRNIVFELAKLSPAGNSVKTGVKSVAVC
jgi:hypothetical protein